MQVVLIDKITGEKTVLIRNLTEEQAQKECDEWGWNYCDESGKSFWMEYEEEAAQ